jgi:DNA-binding transcriptional LysR family regulator
MDVMELSDLRIFKAVVDEGGVTRAAAKVHRVQSNLSARIKSLEADLGHSLFERTGRRMVLTPEGRWLYESAGRLLVMADEVRAGVSADGAGASLRIGSMESTAATRLPDLLARYHQRHAGTRIELSTGTARALLDRLAAAEIDVAFAAGDCSDEAFIAVPAFHEELVLALPPGTPAEHDPGASTLIAFPAGCAYRRIVSDWLRTRGTAPLRTIELASYHAILACVAGGVGWAIVPAALLDIYPQRGLIATRKLPRAVARQTTWLVRRRQSDSPAIEAFRALMAPQG